jgi:DNA modification methylase
MDGAVANLCCVDPPYGVSFKSWDGLEIKNDSLAGEEFGEFLSRSFENIRDHLVPGGSVYVFHADSLTEIFRTAFKKYFHLSAVCVWVKNSLVPGWGDYQYRHEPVLYGYLENAKHKYYGDRKQTTVWEYDKPKSSPDHPTMKPVTLMSYPIKNSTMTNGVVLDPFLGSGSTLIACMETDRVCMGIELDPKFVDVIVKRSIAQNSGNYADVYVIRDGQKLMFDEVATFEPEEAHE